MLAWLHQCAASEKEFLDSLLVPAKTAPMKKYERGMSNKPNYSQNGLSKNNSTNSFSELSEQSSVNIDPLASKRVEMAKFVQTTLDHIMEATCRPLKVRK